MSETNGNGYRRVGDIYVVSVDRTHDGSARHATFAGANSGVYVSMARWTDGRPVEVARYCPFVIRSFPGCTRLQPQEYKDLMRVSHGVFAKKA
jgi:hypothetical protein